MSPLRVVRWSPAFIILSFILGCTDGLPTEPPIDPHPVGVDPDSVVLWSDAEAWLNGVEPRKDGSITIPKGKRVLLDVTTPPLNEVIVEGELLFGARDVELVARRILVRGVLRAGSPKEPHTARAEIVLRGGAGGGLMVLSGGALELHGEKRTAWTRLAESAHAGAHSIQLRESVDWRPGDKIVLTATGNDPGAHDLAEVLSMSGRTITLKRGLTHSHTVYTYEGPTKRYTRAAEVGLLSRNVVIRSQDLTPREGTHVMIMEGGKARVSGVLFHALGTPGEVARYPFHWHLVGRADGDYLKNSSIWESGNRCVTIHGTHGVEVSDNVCHDHRGHGVFLEDGIETGNIIRRNLVSYTRAGRGPLLSDPFPGAFWITNPDNIFEDNVAAGAFGHAYWFAMPEHPTGLSATTSVWPRRTPLGKFKGNVAHSTTGDGLFIDMGNKEDGSATEIYSYDPKVSPSDPSSSSVPALFEDFVTYRNRGRGMWARGVDLHIVGGVFAESAIGADFAAFDVSVSGTLFVGRPSGTEPILNENIPVRGFEFYDGPVHLRDVEFADFDSKVGRPAAAISFLINNIFPVSVRNSVEGLRFVRSKRVLLQDPKPENDGDMGSLIRDLDGSLTGRTGAVVVTDNAFLLTPGCRPEPRWNAHICEGDYGRVQIFHSSATRVDVRRDIDGLVATPHGTGEPSPAYGLGTVTYPEDHAITLTFNSTGEALIRIHRNSPPMIRIRSSTPPSSVQGGFVRDYYEAASLDELESIAQEAFYWDAANQLIHLKPTRVRGGTGWLTVTN